MPDGFGLARASNTTPVVVLRFEGDDREGAASASRTISAACSRRRSCRAWCYRSSSRNMRRSDHVTQELFLGAQPILDRNQNLAAYELLFRSGHFNGATIEDDVFASATVINHAFTELGVEAVLGKHPGYINLSAALLMSDVIELLPRAKVVLEILETVKVTAR